jgi:hypothetical protein
MRLPLSTYDTAGGGDRCALALISLALDEVDATGWCAAVAGCGSMRRWTARPRWRASALPPRQRQPRRSDRHRCVRSRLSVPAPIAEAGIRVDA